MGAESYNGGMRLLEKRQIIILSIVLPTAALILAGVAWGADKIKTATLVAKQVDLNTNSVIDVRSNQREMRKTLKEHGTAIEVIQTDVKHMMKDMNKQYDRIEKTGDRLEVLMTEIRNNH